MSSKKAYEKLEQALRNGPDNQKYDIGQIEQIMGVPISPVYLVGNTIVGSKSCFRRSAEKVGFAITDFSIEQGFIHFVRGGEWYKKKANDSGDETTNAKPSICFEKEEIDDESALNIVIETVKRLYSHPNAKTKGTKRRHPKPLTASQIDEYFTRSDRMFLDSAKRKLSDMQFVFKELAFHAQNGTGLENKIKFMDPKIQKRIASVTNNYDATKQLKKKKSFLSIYSNSTDDVFEEYYSCLSDIQSFLADCVTQFDVLKKIVDDGKGGTYRRPKEIYRSFKKQIKHRYGEALTFDFLKEFGRSFSLLGLDFPKPDKHVKRTMIFIYNKSCFIDAYLENTTGFDEVKTLNSFDAIDLHMELIEKARNALIKHGSKNYRKLKNYVLDKAIYIVCSGLFYLPGHSNKKNRKAGVSYTQWLGNRCFKKTKLTSADIKWFDSFLDRI